MGAAGLNESCAEADRFCRVGTCSDGYCRVISENDALMTTDSNGDTISDYYEIGILDGFTKDNPRDTDNDTVPDYLSIDAAGDGIPNALKAGNRGDMTRKPLDTDGDGTPDYLDSDSDDNGISDAAEFGGLFDKDGNKYDVNIETDDNAHTQSMTITDENGNVVGTAIDWKGQVYDDAGNPVNGLILSPADLDGDTTPDFLDSDVDDDGVSDGNEISGLRVDGHSGRKCTGDQADGNGWCKYGSASNPWDSDNDTIPDYRDMDSDNDTIPDAFELLNDSNNDGALDRYVSDSDGDGVPDKDEILTDANGYYVLMALDGYSDAKDSQGRKLVGTPDGKLLVTDDAGAPIACETGKFLAVDSNSSAYILVANMGSSYDALGTADNIGTLLYESDCSIRTNADGNYLAVDADGNIYAVDPESRRVLTDESGNPRVIGKMPVKPVYAFHSPLYTCDDDACEYKNYCYRSIDCDRDGLSDGKEVWCNGVWSGAIANADGDAYLDAAEWAAADFAIRNHKQAHVDTEVPWIGTCTKTESKFYAINTPADLICNPTLGVENIFDFYFELLPDDAQKSSTLVFRPEVSKLDIVFNMDTTGSMDGEIENLKDAIKGSGSVQGIIPKIKAMVDKSEFAITRFDDFPVSGGFFSDYNYGGSSDLPFALVTAMTNNTTSLNRGVDQLTAKGGADGPESGFQSLWQILMGDDKSWTRTSWSGSNSGSMQYYTPSEDRWGGVNFRNGTLPVVTHITDAGSHNAHSSHSAHANASQCNVDDPYNSYISNPYYADDVAYMYNRKGARIITVFSAGGDDSTNGRQQTYQIAKETNAVVPACAFKNNRGNWICGANSCCTGTNGAAEALDSDINKCVLRFTVDEDGNGLGDTLVTAVDALVKYGTYDVSTVVRKDESDSRVDTTCFIKKVEAKQYVPPCQEPEASCNPPAVASKVAAANYNDGFKNFAPGTSSQERPGAQLHFMVYAQNYDDATGEPCAKQTESVQQFNAYIDVVNPTTGLVFGTRQVSIIVPGKVEHTSVN